MRRGKKLIWEVKRWEFTICPKLPSSPPPLPWLPVGWPTIPLFGLLTGPGRPLADQYREFSYWEKLFIFDFACSQVATICPLISELFLFSLQDLSFPCGYFNGNFDRHHAEDSFGKSCRSVEKQTNHSSSRLRNIFPQDRWGKRLFQTGRQAELDFQVQNFNLFFSVKKMMTRAISMTTLTNFTGGTTLPVW